MCVTPSRQRLPIAGLILTLLGTGCGNSTAPQASPAARTSDGTAAVTPTLLAVASATDNTGETARAGFADLHFTARDTPCQF